LRCRSIRGSPGRRGVAMSNLELFESFLSADEWNFQSDERGFVKMGFTGESGSWKVFFVGDDDGVVAAMSCLEMFIPQGRRQEVSVLFSWINFKLRVGACLLDPSDGEVRFRISYDVEGGEFTREMFRNLLGCNLATMDHWFPAIMSVGYGGVAAEAAFRTANEEFSAGL
jgi:hypothetical protein